MVPNRCHGARPGETRCEVLHQLPERLEKRFFVPMTAQQMQHHEDNREIVGKLVAKWRRYRFLLEADQRRLLIALQNMRMACNSTYLLDQRTDHGTKADELATLLDEVFERPDTKAVIFTRGRRSRGRRLAGACGKPQDLMEESCAGIQVLFMPSERLDEPSGCHIW